EDDPAELARRPQEDLLGEAREIDGEHGGDEEELGDMVAAADGVDRVLAGRVVAELGGRKLGMESDRRARQRGGAERRAGAAPVPVAQAVEVADEPLSMGEKLVREGDGLRRLQMGEAGRQRLAML